MCQGFPDKGSLPSDVSDMWINPASVLSEHKISCKVYLFRFSRLRKVVLSLESAVKAKETIHKFRRVIDYVIRLTTNSKFNKRLLLLMYLQQYILHFGGLTHVYVNNIS